MPEEVTKFNSMKGNWATDISEMLSPTQILKFGRSGSPGFRDFFLSPGLDALAWKSAKKSANKTRIMLQDVTSVKLGQHTEKFKRNNRADLDHFSFSLYYTEPGKTRDTLDLVCKDEKEFQCWTRILHLLVTEGTSFTDAQRAELSEEAHKKKSSNTSLRSGKTNKEGMKEMNDVYVFGSGEWGQNGTGPETDARMTPTLCEALLGKGVKQVACGWSHTLALKEGGEVLHCGSGLATCQRTSLLIPKLVPTLKNIVSLACGHGHSVALSELGKVYAWGTNLHGQCGMGDRNDVLVPMRLEALATTTMGLEMTVKEVACGAHYTAAVTDDCKLYTWGCGDHGCLGHGNTKNVHTPKAVNMNVDVITIACGDSHMLAATTKKECYAWGWNGLGQLGIGTEDDQFTPKVLPTLSGKIVEQLAAGATHSFALVYEPKPNVRQLYSWGSNLQGQLGLGAKKKQNKPFPVAEINMLPIQEVVCGALHTIFRTEEGEAWSCGFGKMGQLGSGLPQDSNAFKRMEYLGDKNVRWVAAGGMHTVVLAAGGWVADQEVKECMMCHCGFSTLNRKHHCRNCGGIFCGKCSDKKMAILKWGLTKPVRVCRECHIKLGGRG